MNSGSNNAGLDATIAASAPLVACGPNGEDPLIGRRRKNRPRTGKRAESPYGDDEPSPDDESDLWCEIGGDLMLVAGCTEGGAPYGTNMAEFRRYNEQWDAKQRWVRAKHALQDAFESPTIRVDVGFVKSLGCGLSRQGFRADVELTPDPDSRSGVYVALIPTDDDPDYRTDVSREAKALRWLDGRLTKVRTPKVVALIDADGDRILVETFVGGVEADLRAGRQPGRPWELVAEVAAAIHGAPPPPEFEPRTRRAHRMDTLAGLEHVVSTDELPRRALAWMREHLGDESSGVLLHGDLLGQNLRIFPDEAPGVIDWRFVAVGDPAADLAVVTRGIRRPFQIEGGRDKLLDAYNHRSTIQVDAASLTFFELALLLRWTVDPEAREVSLNQIARLLGR
jgi:aminoglycoside phosphotransferase (APT) family kinase protein